MVTVSYSSDVVTLWRMSSNTGDQNINVNSFDTFGTFRMDCPMLVKVLCALHRDVYAPVSTKNTPCGNQYKRNHEPLLTPHHVLQNSPGPGKPGPSNFEVSSLNLECQSKESDGTGLLTALLGSSLPVFRRYEAGHVRSHGFPKLKEKYVTRMPSHQKAFMTEISTSTTLNQAA